MRPQEMPRAITAATVVASVLASGAMGPADRVRTARAPRPAAEAGYTRQAFDEEFNDATHIDVAGDALPGFNWYACRKWSPGSSNVSVQVSNGRLMLSGGPLYSGCQAGNPAEFVGHEFSGGAYFEAAIAFDPATVKADDRQWPSWWSMSREHFMNAGDEWTRQAPDFKHFIEYDFFEYDVWRFAGSHAYGAAIHDWFGRWNGTRFQEANNAGVGSKYENFVVSTAADFRKVHRFGALWVPATDTRSGYAQAYFDDKPTSARVDWTNLESDAIPPPGAAPWTFGVMDRHHLVIILSTSTNAPLIVDWVRVWQTPTKSPA